MGRVIQCDWWWEMTKLWKWPMAWPILLERIKMNVVIWRRAMASAFNLPISSHETFCRVDWSEVLDGFNRACSFHPDSNGIIPFGFDYIEFHWMGQKGNERMEERRCCPPDRQTESMSHVTYDLMRSIVYSSNESNSQTESIVSEARWITVLIPRRIRGLRRKSPDYNVKTRMTFFTPSVRRVRADPASTLSRLNSI